MLISGLLVVGCDADHFRCVFILSFLGWGIGGCEYFTSRIPPEFMPKGSDPFVTAATTDFISNVFFPQVAAGGGYSTTITLMHTDARRETPAVGKLRFFLPDGSPRTVNTQEL